MFQCPVCECRGLKRQPYAIWPPPTDIRLVPPYEDQLGLPSYEVCPLCAFEFGNDDNPGTAPPQSFEAYRAEWASSGCPVFDPEAVADLPKEPGPQKAITSGI
jgi:hypothetical protein